MDFCSVLKTLLVTSALAPQIEWDSNNSAISCAFSGNDLANSLSKREDCRSLCASTPSCTHYTWTDFNSGTCWLKENKVTKSDAIFKPDQNALCGMVGLSAEDERIVNEIQWDGQNSAQHCAFAGSDLVSVPSKADECHDLCLSTQDCTHYTWTDYNSGRCWIKSDIFVSKSDALLKLDQNARCGIMERSNFVAETKFNSESTVELPNLNSFARWESFPSPRYNTTTVNNLSQSGQSTRYWDCCKVCDETKNIRL